MIYQRHHTILVITYLLTQTFFIHGMGSWHVGPAQEEQRTQPAFGYSDRDGWLRYGSLYDDGFNMRIQKKEQRLATMRQFRLGKLDNNSIVSLLPVNVLHHIHKMLKEMYESM